MALLTPNEQHAEVSFLPITFEICCHSKLHQADLYDIESEGLDSQWIVRKTPSLSTGEPFIGSTKQVTHLQEKKGNYSHSKADKRSIDKGDNVVQQADQVNMTHIMHKTAEPDNIQNVQSESAYII